MSSLGLTLTLLVAPVSAAGLVGASRRVRRLLCRHWGTSGAFVFASLVTLAAAAGADGWVAGALLGASIALTVLASWIVIARRRGWAMPSTLPRRFDWDGFDVQFHAHAERAAR